MWPVIHTNFGAVKGACDPWHAEQFEKVQYSSSDKMPVADREQEAQIPQYEGFIFCIIYKLWWDELHVCYRDRDD